MEMFCFGIFAGMIVAVIFIAGGAVYAQRDIKRTDGVDSDIRVYVPCRDRSGDQRDNPQVEEVIDVLNTLRVGTTSREKRAIDYAAECVIDREKLIRFIEERSKA